MSINTTLPHSLEAEQGVLTCILIDNDSTIEAFSRLTENDFFSPSHKTIYLAMRDIYERNTPIDFVTLVSALNANGNLDKVGGLQYITTLNESLPSSANFKHYLVLLQESRILRRLLNAAGQISETARTTQDAQAALQSAERAIFDIAREDERRELTPIGHEIAPMLDRLDMIKRDPTLMQGLQTGFWEFDRMTNGLQKGDLVILAARPSVGKTALALNISTNAAFKDKVVAIFSLEMSKQSLTMRATCSVARVDISKVMKGDTNADEIARLMSASHKLEKAKIYIDDNSIITPAEMMRKCMRLKREIGLDFVMIDYLGLMGGGGSKRESRQVEVADNSRFIKIMAKELNVPVLLLSQLNRGIEARKGMDSRPVLSDLRESGAIEQDADIVMFIHKEKSEDNQPVEEVELVVAKHRNGPTGIIKLKWIGENTRFENMAK
ncbi:MAG: replicative DNA helicase [Firmicutes bacterium]|nr:replicative DNA helicase [Bacillota bacterium]